MSKWIIAFSLLLTYGIAEAHQPDLSSTLLVEQGENKWVLQIRAALTAFEYEIHQHYGKDAYATPEEFQNLVLNYVQSNVSLMCNKSNDTELENGSVQLGHETKVVFEVKGIPETLEQIEFQNSSFKDISRNQSALIIVKKDFAKQQIFLNNENQHTAKLKVKDSKFVVMTDETNRATVRSSILSGLGFLLVFGGVGLCLLFRKNTNVIA
ncbi:MAG: hypothetical protein Sapg2KO_26460 [Saprospiraceae bacterium]